MNNKDLIRLEYCKLLASAANELMVAAEYESQQDTKNAISAGDNS